MNRIDECLANLKANNKKALVSFVLCGDPTLDYTKQLILDLANSGTDIIQLGIPFSDPIAQGPTIQDASKRSIEAGTNLKRIIEMVIEIRKLTNIPLMFILYANTVYSKNINKFFKRCKEIGIDAVLIPDLPYEELAEFENESKQYGIKLIRTLTPSSTTRVKMIVDKADSFVSCISSSRTTFINDLTKLSREIRDYSSIYTLLELDVCTSKEVEILKNTADGIIINSVIVELIEEYKDLATPHILSFIKELRTILDK
ncbi:MAG: tryptophan synthase subunit alpha [Erysipelotrichaceae bacterium]